MGQDLALPPPGPVVVVEVVALRLAGPRRLGHRVRRAALTGGSPDTAALALVGLTSGTAPPGTVSHSTSWRAHGEQVVLTYAVLPDPQPDLPCDVLAPVGVVCSSDPLLPAPERLHEHHVVAHAVRHLAALAATDPTVAAAARRHPGLWSELARWAGRVRVGTHDDAHSGRSGPALTG